MSLPSELLPVGLLGTGVAAEEGYSISRSVRFNSSDSAYLSRTPSSAGNRRTWTWSGWVKLSNLSTSRYLFASTTATNDASWFTFLISSQNNLYFVPGYNVEQYKTEAVFRDPSAWYHVVFSVDTTQSVLTNRYKIYVNNIQQTYSGVGAGSAPSQNAEHSINNTGVHEIGRYPFGSADYLDGYLADVHFIDGQALDPTSFGEFDDNGIWQPKAYSGGSYGTNGFHLDFSDNSTAAALGTDSSGNGNTWSVNNISVGANRYIGGTVTTTGSASLSNLNAMFDGDVNTETSTPPGDGTVTYTFPEPVAFTQLEMSGWDDAGLDVNGTSVTSLMPSYSGRTALTNITSLVSSPLTSIKFYRSGGLGSGVSRIRINGSTYLIDNQKDNDSLVDVPTNGTETDTGVGGEVRGNYATWNPLDGNSQVVPSNGNLDLYSNADFVGRGATIAVSSGKWYWEVTAGDGSCITGIWDGSVSVTSYPGAIAGSYGYFDANGNLFNNGSSASYGAGYTQGDVIGHALDLDAGTLTFYKNGVSQGVAATGLTGSWKPAMRPGNQGIPGTAYGNFGQRPFAYTAPSGFKALNTANLDAPVVTKPSEYMDVALYTGNGGTNTISGLEFSPDLVWIKSRGSASNHAWYDIIRGVGKGISSSLTDSEYTATAGVNELTAFNSDGFSLGPNQNFSVNSSSIAFAAWTWDAGSSTVSNTDGSITSTVRANPSAGFSIVTFNMGSNGAKTVGHGLNAEPHLIITKCRTDAFAWRTYHKSATTIDQLLELNSTGAVATSVGHWGSAAPTSSVFGITSGQAQPANQDCVAYCFAPVDGYSSFGSYTGNGSTDGPFVYTGFRPAFVMFKRSDSTGDWIIFDNKRNTHEGNYREKVLYPNKSNAEETSADGDTMLFLSNGFKLNNVTYAYWNANGGIYVWAAFAEHPFQYARAR